VKKLIIACLISLLLIGCNQPDTQEMEASVPVDEAEEVVEVTSLKDSELPSNQKKTIIPLEDQIVQVTFTQEALEQIAQDLDGSASRGKFLKIKPAID